MLPRSLNKQSGFRVTKNKVLMHKIADSVKTKDAIHSVR